MCFRSPSSAPVSRPTAERSPHKSPSPQGRGLWGERGGSNGARAAPPQRGRSVAQSPQKHGQRRLCGRRATKGAAGDRLARRSSRWAHYKTSGCWTSAARLRAWRVTGEDGLAGAAPQSAALQAAPASPSRRARSRSAGRKTDRRAPDTGRAAALFRSAGAAGLVVLRQGWRPVRGETKLRAGGSTRSATARPGAAGDVRKQPYL